MKNLTEVTLEMSSAENKDCCTYQGSRMDDRKIHRDGMCIIHLGTLFARCPRLQNFNGVNIGEFPMFPTSKRAKKTKEKTKENNPFSKWNAKMKPLFYEEYQRSGGQMDWKSWCSKRWFCKQPSITGRPEVTLNGFQIFPCADFNVSKFSLILILHKMLMTFENKFSLLNYKIFPIYQFSP